MASSRHQPGIARISATAPQMSRTKPVTSTKTASTAAASGPVLARWALASPAPVSAST
jgi:hypothetical protein